MASVSGSVTTMRVGLRHERGQLARGVELVDVRDGAGGVALDRQHAHAERLREPGRLAPDLAEADDQQRAVAQLAHGPLPRRPVARALVGEQRREALGEGEQAEQRELGQRAGVDAGGARDRDAARVVGRELQRLAELLAGAGVAGLDPLEPRRPPHQVDEPLAGAPGDAEATSARSSASAQRGSSSATPPSPTVSPLQRAVGSSSGRYVSSTPSCAAIRSACSRPSA